MAVNEQVTRWREQCKDPTLARQLAELIEGDDPEALNDAFYRDLEFGTAGLRGILGPGTNRMNIHTVGKATQGLANYLVSLPKGHCSVAISHDSRHNSRLFAQTAASVLAANGVHAFIYARLEPTPALSFATRYLNCDAGINVTASHNPAAYNGYKVYGPDGCQITSSMADAIQQAIAEVDEFHDVKSMDFDEGISSGMISVIPEEVLDAFLDAVFAQSLTEPGDEEGEVSVVYTPLNGTGLECVSRILKAIGVKDVTVVPEQSEPDGDFPTCPYPNPESREALKLGIELCESLHPDLLLATDPDADRVGIAVEHEGAYVLPTGNEIGLLLLDYIGRRRRELGRMPAHPVVVSTIVSTDMLDKLAAHYGMELRRVLTGFKYIGEVIAGLEAEGRVEDFVFGFEESYGYLSGPHVRDKDAVNASMLICEMARYHRQRGRNLIEALQELYEEFGYHQTRTISVSFEGEAGAAAMLNLMKALRAHPPTSLAGSAVVAVVDYAAGVNGLPPANVVELELDDGCKVILRPSGTEPKIKAYIFARGVSQEEAAERIDELSRAAEALLRVDALPTPIRK